MNKKQITMDEDFFEHLLNCLANQKFIGEAPPNGDAMAMEPSEYRQVQIDNQMAIDDAWRKGMNMLTNTNKDEDVESERKDTSVD